MTDWGVSVMIRDLLLQPAILPLVLLLGINSGNTVAGNEPESADLSEESILPENPLEGLNVLREKGCIQCHTIWGIGGKPLGPDLAYAARDRSLMQLVGLLWSHSPQMIEVIESKGMKPPALNADEMRLLLSYLYSLNFFDESGDPSLGEETFRAKRCDSCHSIGSVGGSVGPALDSYGSVMSPVILAAAIWNHSAAMSTRMNQRMMPGFDFHGTDVADLMAFVRARSIPDGRPRQYLLPGNPRRGMAVFRSKQCVACHSTRGSITVNGPTLRRGELYGNASLIAGEILNHSTPMSRQMMAKGIELPTLESQEMADLVAYIYFIKFLDDPGDVAKGRSVYESKSCDLCHGDDNSDSGMSGTAPTLFGSEAVRSPYHLASFMWNHAPEMAAELDDFGLTWPRFENDEMRDLVSYLQSVAP